MPKMVVSFTLDTEADRDLVRWLERLPKRQRSAMIRQALREHVGRGGVSLGDVYQAVKALERRLQSGAVIVSGEASDDGRWDEPPDLVAALERLASL